MKHPQTRPNAGDMARKFLGKTADMLDQQERRVLEGIVERQPMSRDVADIADEQTGFWGRLADRVAAVGGSWGFIFGFMLVLFGWMLLNSGLFDHWRATFDPYPFIFLNLVLSTLAAIQAPIIMMSQNRQSAKDRIAAAHDYEVNLKAELEIMRLHEKIDALRIEHLEALTRQQAQILDLLQRRLDSGDPASTGPATG
ncbi:DUF1003 domain-containing protein [Tistrella bauzanensis]|uniref:DUF1003 domain-containing protein n=1 Tax=Tistrella arctica TaxID=3133430 RepID=A0ABU9YQE2_9PROT